MTRFVRITLPAGLLGALLLGCAKPKAKEEPPQKIVSLEEAMEMQKKANAQHPPPNMPPQGNKSGPEPNQKIGSAAPVTVSHDLGGKEVKLSDLKGKVVVLDFWATWCGPCRAMIPHTNQLYEKLKGKPVVIVSISADDNKETVTNFLKTTKMPWNHWFDGRGGPLARLYGANAIPTVYVIDHKGVIRYHQVGGGPQLDTEVEKLVKAAEEDKVASR
jgi:thiol-disulfide isomerase/thioredoxin